MIITIKIKGQKINNKTVEQWLQENMWYSSTSETAFRFTGESEKCKEAWVYYRAGKIDDPADMVPVVMVVVPVEKKYFFVFRTSASYCHEWLESNGLKKRSHETIYRQTSDAEKMW